MSTNVTVTSLDFKRFPVTGAIETGIQLEGTNTARYIRATARDAVVRLSRSPGGTYSTDDYVTLVGDDSLLLEDMALQPLDALGTFVYARADGANAVLELTWGQ